MIPDVWNVTGTDLDKFAFKKILPLCVAPPNTSPLKLVPKLPNSVAVISKILGVASVDPFTWIKLLVVDGLRVSRPAPSTVDDQSILLPINVRLPIPDRAAVIEIAPVPEFKVSPLPLPVIALAMVMTPLLALLLRVKSAFKVTGLELPRVMLPTPAELVLVVMVPPKLKDEGDDGANEPPAYVKVSLAESPMVSVPVVSNGVAVEKLVIEFVDPVMPML